MKTKVIAFRVNEREYNAMTFMASKEKLKLSEYVNKLLSFEKAYALQEFAKEEKRLEAKAKRDAKKAAANGVQ